MGRTFPVVVWTESELIVWGGEKPSEAVWHADGAAFDPTAGTWRDLSASPLAPRSEHVAVWSGNEVIICCGRQMGKGVSAGSYNPATDEWREIAVPPINPAFAEAVWTGEEMLVFGGVSVGGEGNLRNAAAYDPVEDNWRVLADMPYGLERAADAVLGNGVVFAWPSGFGSARSPNPLAYDISADEWTGLPGPPDGSPSWPSLVWTGNEMIAWGAGQSGAATSSGVSYDPAKGSWAVLPPAPLDPVDFNEGTQGSQALTWTGNEVLVWTGWVGTDWNEPVTNVLAFNPTRSAWREVEPAPLLAQGLWHEPITWTGSLLVTYTNPMLILTP